MLRFAASGRAHLSACTTPQVMTDITTKTKAALAAIAEAASLEALEEQRLDALGKKGWVSLALKTSAG